jgi:predicted HTH domain antitoxin
MNLMLHIPDEFAEQLSAGGDVEREALEALALESYRAGRLTKAELRRLLGFQVLDQIDGFLKAHNIYETYTVEDIEREVQGVQRLGF